MHRTQLHDEGRNNANFVLAATAKTGPGSRALCDQLLTEQRDDHVPSADASCAAISAKDPYDDLSVLSMRLGLLRAIRTQVRSWNITRPQAARRLGIPVNRLDDLLSETLASFSLNELIKLAPGAGLVVHFIVAPTAS